MNGNGIRTQETLSYKLIIQIVKYNENSRNN